MANEGLGSIGKKLSIPDLEDFKKKPENEQQKVIKRLSKEIKRESLTQKELALLKSEILDAKDYKKAAKLFQKIFVPNPEKKLKKTINRMQNDRARSLLSKKSLTADEMKEIQTHLPLLLMQARKDERREIVQKCIDSPGLVAFLAEDIKKPAFKELVKAAYLPEGKVLTGKETLLFQLFEKNPELLSDEAVLSLVEVVIFDDMVEKSKTKGALFGTKESFMIAPFPTERINNQEAAKLLFGAMADAYIKTLTVVHGENMSDTVKPLIKDVFVFDCLINTKNANKINFTYLNINEKRMSKEALKGKLQSILRKHDDRLQRQHQANNPVQDLGAYSSCVAGSQALLSKPGMSKLDIIVAQFFIETSKKFEQERKE